MTATEKRQTFELLQRDGPVMVHLDARRPGVQVPKHFAGAVWLRLNFNLPRGAGDLVVNDWGVSELLCFGGTWQTARVPWSAIFGVSVPGSPETLQPDESDS
jgi:stringent starvation protein B